MKVDAANLDNLEPGIGKVVFKEGFNVIHLIYMKEQPWNHMRFTNGIMTKSFFVEGIHKAGNPEINRQQTDSLPGMVRLDDVTHLAFWLEVNCDTMSAEGRVVSDENYRNIKKAKKPKVRAVQTVDDEDAVFVEGQHPGFWFLVRL